jgi:putative Mn2+ efflux pump MntP
VIALDHQPTLPRMIPAGNAEARRGGRQATGGALGGCYRPRVSFGATLLLSVGLAMDAMAVSAARGLSLPRLLARHVLLVALLFGGAQALMPLLGWFVGAELGPCVETWDHWFVFALLGGLGAKMLFDAGVGRAAADSAAADSAADPFAYRTLFALAIATSIDAFGAGLSLPVLGAALLPSIVTIGLTTAVLCGVGLFAGRKLGKLLGRRLDIVGGSILIGLGTKTLVEHLTAH